MNMKTEINEMMLRRAIMQRTDISAANKLVLLAILLKVDWQTWSGPATVGELSTLSGISKRSVQTTLKKLDGELIKRGWTNHQDKMLPTIKIITAKILHPPADLAFKCEKYAPPCEKSASKCEKSAPLQPIQPITTNNTTINTREEVANDEPKLDDDINLSHSISAKNWGEIIQQSQAEDLAQKAIHPEHKQLTLEQQRIISQHVRFTGHAERVRVARKLLNIKLMKGGYYEPII